MRNDLISRDQASNNLIRVCLERSAATCLKKYQKDIYSAETGEGPNGWLNDIKKCNHVMNEENQAVFRAIHVIFN